MDWSTLYPDFFTGNPSEKETPRVEFADIGCGYGGLLGSWPSTVCTDNYFALYYLIATSIHHHPLFFLSVELSTLFPDKLMLGLEIRVKVSDYVRDRIQSLRASEPGRYQNIACIRSNAMKYLPNFFCKGQVGLHLCMSPDRTEMERRVLVRVWTRRLTSTHVWAVLPVICAVEISRIIEQLWWEVHQPYQQWALH